MTRKKDGTNAVMDDTEEDVVTRIAWLYYKEKMTQAEIADRISLSRQKVQRLLEKARDLEIIRFTLKHPYVNLLSVESRLKEELGLRDAVVVPAASADVDHLRASMAKAGAEYLERRLSTERSCILGLGWGNTTAHLADFFDGQSITGKIEVVSLIGNLMMNVSMNPYIMGDRIANKLDAPFYNIWAPAIAQTKERAEAFRSEPWIKDVLDKGCKANVNLIPIGELSRAASLFKMGYLSAADLKRLGDKGAVGDILSQFFDAEGEIIDDEVHNRVIGVPLETLRAGKKINIGVAGGASKVKAIKAAAAQGYINVLITDEKTAVAVLR